MGAARAATDSNDRPAVRRAGKAAVSSPAQGTGRLQSAHRLRGPGDCSQLTGSGDRAAAASSPAQGTGRLHVALLHLFTANLGGSARISVIVQAISAIRHQCIEVLNHCARFVRVQPISSECRLKWHRFTYVRHSAHYSSGRFNFGVRHMFKALFNQLRHYISIQ